MIKVKFYGSKFVNDTGSSSSFTITKRLNSKEEIREIMDDGIVDNDVYFIVPVTAVVIDDVQNNDR